MPDAWEILTSKSSINSGDAYSHMDSIITGTVSITPQTEIRTSKLVTPSLSVSNLITPQITTTSVTVPQMKVKVGTTTPSIKINVQPPITVKVKSCQ